MPTAPSNQSVLAGDASMEGQTIFHEVVLPDYREAYLFVEFDGIWPTEKLHGPSADVFSPLEQLRESLWPQPKPR